MLQCPCFTTPFARSFQPGIICPKCYLQLVCFTAKIGKRKKNTVLERILRKSGGANDRLERLLLSGRIETLRMPPLPPRRLIPSAGRIGKEGGGAL